MQDHRNAGTATESAPHRANTPPSTGNVHGLGVVDALHIDLEPMQLPWLVAEIEALRAHFEQEADEHRRSGAREAENEINRRAYQLKALAMIRDQIPMSGEAAAAAVVSAPPGEPRDEPIAVVGPAALMTVLIRGATCKAADVLGEQVRGPGLSDATLVDRLHAMVAVSHAYIDTHRRVVATLAYSFDSDYQPVYADELD